MNSKEIRPTYATLRKNFTEAVRKVIPSGFTHLVITYGCKNCLHVTVYLTKFKVICLLFSSARAKQNAFNAILKSLRQAAPPFYSVYLYISF
jgi:hypothetical protein